MQAVDFNVNRVNGMVFLEAIRLLERGGANAEDIDKAIRLVLGYPMGPFELMDQANRCCTQCEGGHLQGFYDYSTLKV